MDSGTGHLTRMMKIGRSKAARWVTQECLLQVIVRPLTLNPYGRIVYTIACSGPNIEGYTP